jgi:hypothetical protein
MPDRRGAWRQPLPARRPGCVPVPDPALRGEADGTDRDEHDVEQQLQLGLCWPTGSRPTGNRTFACQGGSQSGLQAAVLTSNNTAFAYRHHAVPEGLARRTI